MELKIVPMAAQQAIEFNYDELKAWVTEKADFYKSVIYNEENIKEAKADRATINKFIKAINDARKEKKKELLIPYQEFESKIKELETIISEPMQIMDAEIKKFEENKKNQKLEEIKQLWEKVEGKPEWLKCNMIADKKWLNATTSLSAIEKDMRAKVDDVINKVKWISEMPFHREALELFKGGVDFDKAMEEGKQIFEFNQNLEKKWEDEKKQAAQSNGSESEQIPGQTSIFAEEPAPKEEKKLHLVFECDITKTQAVKLKEFADSIGISIKRIK